MTRAAAAIALVAATGVASAEPELATGVVSAEEPAPATVDDVGPVVEAAPAAPAEPAERNPPQAERASLVPALSAGPVHARITGSFLPRFGLTHHAAASERDRWGYGVEGSRIDVALDVEAGADVWAELYLKFGTTADGDGEVDVEFANVGWSATPVLDLVVGRDTVPLTAQSATKTAARVFPSRLDLDEKFVLPADVGAQAIATIERVTAMVGVWNGIAGDAMLEPGATERGLLYSARVELTPLGRFAFDEAAYPRDLRIGIGVAATYRAATAFTATGAMGTRSRDLRGSLGLRAAWRGLFAQAELLRRQITDDLSMRPDVATLGYLQASWRFALGSIDVAPMGRAAIHYIRQLSAPARGSTVEAGAALFPLARTSDRLHITLLYAILVDPDLGRSDQVSAQLRLRF